MLRTFFSGLIQEAPEKTHGLAQRRNDSQYFFNLKSNCYTSCHASLPAPTLGDVTALLPAPAKVGVVTDFFQYAHTKKLKINTLHLRHFGLHDIPIPDFSRRKQHQAPPGAALVSTGAGRAVRRTTCGLNMGPWPVSTVSLPVGRQPPYQILLHTASLAGGIKTASATAFLVSSWSVQLPSACAEWRLSGFFSETHGQRARPKSGITLFLPPGHRGPANAFG